jgi:UDP-glucuronate 4-epimerase
MSTNGTSHSGSALITGGAGFIGSHLADQLLADGWEVTVVDNFDPYYDPAVKRSNVEPHTDDPAYHLAELDIRDLEALRSVFLGASFDVIVHLAARAGVRASINDPITCQQVNVTGTQNLLELAQEHGVPQFIFGSSSSVYGTNPDVPWSEEDHDLRPISPYASTKLSAEFLGHTYQHLYDLRFIALRFFTVYGPRQRPDLAIHKFARLALEEEPIPVYGDGTTRRDYTFVGDIIRGIRAAMQYDEEPYAIMNVGSGQPIELNDMIDALEDVVGKDLERNHLPEQPGDVPQTWADISRAKERLSYEPQVKLRKGIRRFLDSHFADWSSQPSVAT